MVDGKLRNWGARYGWNFKFLCNWIKKKLKNGKLLINFYWKGKKNLLSKVTFKCTVGQYVIKPLKLIETISLENVLICPLTRAYFRSYRTQICVYVHLAEVPTCRRLKMLCWRGQTVGTAIWCLLMGSVPLQEVSVSGGPN